MACSARRSPRPANCRRCRPPSCRCCSTPCSANTFTEAEAKAIGLVDEQSIDWNGKLDVELDAEPEVHEVDIQIDGMPEPEPVEPSRGSSLADHVQIGFAYQMHIDGEWHKVRLSHVSAGRTFFVFTRGHKHLRTISMTYRMLSRLCEANRLRAYEHAYLLERATARARHQLSQLRVGGKAPPAASAKDTPRTTRAPLRSRPAGCSDRPAPRPAMSNAVP